jgi:UDP-N-acetylglucosamine 4,6-dehydratase/5-epimerase
MNKSIFNNKVILITGGTGSFGKKFIEIIYKKYKPKKVIIYSRDEFKQFELMKIYKKKRYKGIRFFLGDIRDKDRLIEALRGVNIVIHAAALKQLTLAEENPQECIKTNIYGSQNVIDACIYNKVKTVMALSTDKAANPVNLYGATKLAAEKIFINSNLLSKDDSSVFSVVRYGNVINSRGSVIPYFKSLVKNGSKTLPLTDLEMTRFFITLEQSVEFVISCVEKMMGGEIFVPKLPSIKIKDIGKALNPKIKYKIIGRRAGEKIHEIMCPPETDTLTYEFKNFYLILPSIKLPLRNNHQKIIKKYNGRKVTPNFSYSSEINKFLSISKIKDIVNIE